MYKEVQRCRVCGSDQLTVLFELGNQSLTGIFPKSKTENVESGPVTLVKCSGALSCGLVQLRESYDPSKMYGMGYGYRSGLNSSMVDHLKSKVDAILAMDVLKTGDVIIDIGSNDGTTLSFYPGQKFRLIGIDPTADKFSEYYPSDVEIVPMMFTNSVASSLLSEKKAKVITSFSMFYDLESPVQFAEDVHSLLDDEGIWVFEQSYLPSMLETNSFDTICHEHLEFYGLHQIEWILNRVGMKIVDVEFNAVNGGSFSITAAQSHSSIVCQTEKISNILAQEVNLGLDTAVPFYEFASRISNLKRQFLEFVSHARDSGKTIAALGASTKGNVLLQYYDLDSRSIFAIGEVNSEKFGCFSPGSLIPIISEDEVLQRDPDYLVVLPWHFRGFFESSEKFKGRTLVFPLPELEIVAL